ncbi:unnamed protein product [Caenorhabditis angaria]|uniref:Uncharacterized protein n=1 Tax=Caenorhabditis angaria TaxID=860376 RepID=A0A9P1J1A3_9PELO|nr:unnamed protein product [Caenorhabditis angaria]
MIRSPKMEAQQSPTPPEELLSPRSPEQPASPTPSPRAPSPKKDMVKLIQNDIRPQQITIVHNKDTPQYCLVPCPVYHLNKKYQLRFSIHGIARIVCDCSYPELLVDPQKFTSLTSYVFKKFAGNLDPIVRRLELRENVKNYDPTIHVPPIVPHDMVSCEPKEEFNGNEYFKKCSNDHVGKPVHIIAVRGNNMILVCDCLDKLNYGTAASHIYSTRVVEYYHKKEVYSYSNPARRNFVAIPQTGFEVI